MKTIQLLLLLFAVTPTWAQNQNSLSVKMQQLHEKLIGYPALKQSKYYQHLIELDKKGQYQDAANFLVHTDAFANTTLRTFASRFSANETEPAVSMIDDLQLQVIGHIISDNDFREVLTSEYYFDFGTNPLRDNPYYLFRNLENYDLKQKNHHISEIRAKSGIITTHQFASLNFDGGTNRRPVKYLMEKFLCSPINSWKDASLPDDFVRRDIDREPGKDRNIYLTQCRSCHAPMDAMAEAFTTIGNFNSNKSTLVTYFKPFTKTLQNEETYPKGHVPKGDNNWKNYLVNNPNLGFEPSAAEGNDYDELAEALSNAKAFRQCMVQRSVRELCPQSSFSKADVEKLTQDFAQNKYNMNYLFAHVALNEKCQLNTSTQQPEKMSVRNIYQHIQYMNAILATDTPERVNSTLLKNIAILPAEGLLSEVVAPLGKVALTKVATYFCYRSLEKWGLPPFKRLQKDNLESRAQLINTIYQHLFSRPADKEETDDLLNAFGNSAKFSTRELSYAACTQAASSLEFMIRGRYEK